MTFPIKPVMQHLITEKVTLNRQDINLHHSRKTKTYIFIVGTCSCLKKLIETAYYLQINLINSNSILNIVILLLKRNINYIIIYYNINNMLVIVLMVRTL